jgi:hypothetical protein
MRPQHWVYTIPLRLRSLFCRRQADQELDDELRDHVERKTEEYIAKGLPPAAARRQTLLEIGGIEKRKEECGDARRVNWIQDLAQDPDNGGFLYRDFDTFVSQATTFKAIAFYYRDSGFSRAELTNSGP